MLADKDRCKLTTVFSSLPDLAVGCCKRFKWLEWRIFSEASRLFNGMLDIALRSEEG